MANKTISQLPNAAAVATDELEKQVTGGGASQKMTVTQLLTFIQNNATAFAQAIVFSGTLTSSVPNRFSLNPTSGACSFATGAFTVDSSGNVSGSSLNIGAGNFQVGGLGDVVTVNDIEITDTIKGLILKSPNGTRYRLQVDNAGNLGTVAA